MKENSELQYKSENVCFRCGKGEMEMNHPNYIGDRIREIRKEKNLTQERAAELCGMSVKGYEKIERGESDPRVSTMIRVIFSLGADFTIFTEYAEQIAAKWLEEILRREEEKGLHLALETGGKETVLRGIQIEE